MWKTASLMDCDGLRPPPPPPDGLRWAATIPTPTQAQVDRNSSEKNYFLNGKLTFLSKQGTLMVQHFRKVHQKSIF